MSAAWPGKLQKNMYGPPSLSLATGKVTDVLWPDFQEADLERAILDFQRRERRFGLTSEQLTGTPKISNA